MSADALAYRPAVGILLLNPHNLVFVAKRIDMPSEAWQMPQGGMDDGETPEEAAFRELKEEIGTHNAEIIAESKDWLTYDLPEPLIGKLWGGKYRGQKQKWFAMRFLGEDAEINLDTEEPEFLEWKWEQLHRTPELIVPFKRELYQKLVDEFGHLAG
ncbi:MAG: RNA pyrophosphohydrolase [Rickettsiales bacterium]